jgi:hypothetical protein
MTQSAFEEGGAIDSDLLYVFMPYVYMHLICDDQMSEQRRPV